MDKTAKLLATMLKENTGVHMMDSGGANGRMWQRNEKRDFEKEPESWIEVDFEKDGIATEWRVVHSTYHFLKNALRYNAAMDAQYQRKYKNSDEAYFADMQDFVDDLKDRYGIKGIYGDGEPITQNTYNVDGCLLDQVIQFIYWEDESGKMDERAHVVLHTHNGADVRGGYSKPHVFDVVEEMALFRSQDASVQCGKCEKYWQTDDGYHFYEEGSTAGKQLETYDLKVIDGSLQCPHCKEGVLSASN